MSSRIGLVLVLAFTAYGASSPAEATEEQRPPVVVIDPGHGGDNQGAPGLDGRREKDITLPIARQVRDLLEARSNVRVVLTREGDVHVGLRERSEIATHLSADAFVSIHANSSAEPGPRGFETFYLSERGANEALHREQGRFRAGIGATEVVREIVADLVSDVAQRDGAGLAHAMSNGLRSQLRTPSRGVKEGAYTVLVSSTVPATVVELGFLNHPEEGPALSQPDYQAKVANGLALGILDFLTRSGRLTF